MQEQTAHAAGEEEGTHPSPHTVIGLGASAGGLTALRSFFAGIPSDSGMSFVVVVHLNPEHESHLADLLQPHVPMPVRQVADTVALEPDQVYVIPPGANLSAIDTHLRVIRMDGHGRQRAPIDHFFRTLANTYDGHAIGIILTGTGSDGALGIREIKAKGGLTLVQDPLDAEFDGMPQSAIATGMVDLVLPLAEIPGAVLRFVQTRPKVAVPEEGEGAEDLEGEQRRLFQRLFAFLHARTNRDFSRYKTSTVARRVQRRMQLRQLEELEQYLQLLRNDTDEVRALSDYILVTVTNFFRDTEVFEEMASAVVPQLFEGKNAQESIRAWSVGCATGEEAYSLAILLIEEAGRREHAPHIQVFASDLHERSLERAREGFFPGDIELDVSAERLRRFFHKEDGGYRVRKEVRELVVFAPHNLLKDPPFSRIDLITCRNVLIYLQRDVQRDVVELFHYALRPDGYLVLGTAETVESADLFRTESKRHCIFRKRNVPALEPRLPVFPILRARVPGEAKLPPAPAESISYGALHLRLLARHAPASMLLSPDQRVVHLSEGAGRFLVHPGGELTASAFKLVRDELRIELRAALHAAREQRRPVRSRPIPLLLEGEPALVIVDVRPALEPDQEGFALVFFEESASAAVEPSTMLEGQVPGEARELQAELDVARQRLQTIIEEYETSQEEMKAANEELQSANEELRSTLEELETSKEELQSMNEELQTVNQENRHKVEELGQLSGDLQNLLAASEIATLFLDRELRILRFTPKVSELFNVRPTDRGRPLSDLTHRLGYGELTADAESVLKRLIPIEREVQDEQGHWYIARVLPYRSAQDRIEGVVVTFVDITERKRSEEALRASEASFRGIVEVVPSLLWRNDAGGNATWFNEGWLQYTGQTMEEALGSGWGQALHPDDRAVSRERFLAAVGAQRPLRHEFRIRRADGSYRWFLVQARAVSDAADETVWFGAATDIHEQREALDLAQQAREEAESARRELQRAHAELEQRVAARTEELARANEALAREVRERTTAEQARTELLRQLASAEEEERRRLSRELHDHMGQLLTALTLRLRALQNLVQDEAVMHALRELEELAERTAAEVQDLALELRPPALDNVGLPLALQGYLQEWSERSGIPADFHGAGLEGERFPTETETALYRVAQEALTNVLKHAQGTRVSVLLEQRRGMLALIVEDDGRGFEVAELASQADPRRLGLRGMKERISRLGGELEIESSPGSGTTVFARVPLPVGVAG